MAFSPPVSAKLHQDRQFGLQHDAFERRHVLTALWERSEDAVLVEKRFNHFSGGESTSRYRNSFTATHPSPLCETLAEVKMARRTHECAPSPTVLWSVNCSSSALTMSLAGRRAVSRARNAGSMLLLSELSRPTVSASDEDTGTTVAFSFLRCSCKFSRKLAGDPKSERAGGLPAIAEAARACLPDLLAALQALRPRTGCAA